MSQGFTREYGAREMDRVISQQLKPLLMREILFGSLKQGGVITIETHVADCYSCILHPASHTHRQLSDEQLRAAGIAPDLMRLSIGLEDPEDIIADIANALEAASK